MRASDPMPNIMLSVKDEVDNIDSVPTRTLREMFDSAASLTNEDGNVVPLPGSKDGKIYIVANNIKPTDPFMVKFAPSTVTAACENKCARWMGFKTCEHTIAVVSVLGNLKNYLKSFKKQEEKRGNTSNITKLVNVNMPANRGKKAKEATQRRKGKVSKTSSMNVTSYSQPTRNDEKQNKNLKDISTIEQPCHLTFLAGLIKKCYGCGQVFSPGMRSPPNDLILKRFDFRKYKSPGSKTEKRSQVLQNTYFHLNRDCVRRICPRFEVNDIIIHQETIEQLCIGHKNILRNLGLEIHV